MQLTDTHTHIYLPELREQLPAILQRARKNAVTRFFLPNIDSSSVEDVFYLNDTYPGICFPMMGLHPCSVKENYRDELNVIEASLTKRKIYAIGEIGIDLYWDKTFLREQQWVFKSQIAWAKKMNLPIVIHCRDAFDEVYEILLEEKDEKLKGIFHCFTGTSGQARKITELDFYLGIGGVVTYKNAGLDKVLKEINLKHLVLETDSPYLSPVPHRGKPNESAYLLYVAEKLSDIYEIPLEQIAEQTTKNASDIFGL